MSSQERLEELGAWFEAEYEGLLRFAYFVSGDVGAAEDLVQDTFLRLYRTGSRLQRPGLRPYARATVLNLARSSFRRSKVARLSPIEARDDAAAAPDIGTRDEVWRAILSLSPRQRACIALRYYEDMSEADIAATLRMSAGSVKKHMDRAITKLRVLLDDRRSG